MLLLMLYWNVCHVQKKPEAGDVVQFPRRLGYSHYGVCVGDDQVAHMGKGKWSQYTFLCFTPLGFYAVSQDVLVFSAYLPILTPYGL